MHWFKETVVIRVSLWSLCFSLWPLCICFTVFVYLCCHVIPTRNINTHFLLYTEETTDLLLFDVKNNFFFIIFTVSVHNVWTLFSSQTTYSQSFTITVIYWFQLVKTLKTSKEFSHYLKSNRCTEYIYGPRSAHHNVLNKCRRLRYWRHLTRILTFHMRNWIVCWC